MKKTQVMVVGAGPVGATAAYMLAQQGIDVVLIEADDDCREDLRASTFHAATLEMMHALGVSKELHQVGLVAPVYQYRDRHTNECFNFDLSELSDVTDFPYRLQCEQWKLARLMVKRLTQIAPESTLFSHRLIELDVADKCTRVLMETPTGQQTFECEYLIAADGANSIVRKAMNIEFEGFTYPEKFLTLSTQYPVEDHFTDLALVNYISDPDEWSVVLRVPDLWRVQIAIPEDSDEQDMKSDAIKDGVFRRLLGDGVEVETVHRTIYRVHQRVAKNYVKGRVILVGDAAHLNNPLGGLGMNSGIHDVWNLCPRLVKVLRGEASAVPQLALYERQRRTIMQSFIQEQTIRNKRFMDLGDQDGRMHLLAEMRDIQESPERRRDYLMTQSMLTSRITEAAIS